MKEKLKKLQELAAKRGIFFSYKNKRVEDAVDSMVAPLNQGKKILGGAYITDESKYFKWKKEKREFFAIVVVPVNYFIDPKPKQYDDMQNILLDVAKQAEIQRAELGASYVYPSVVIFKDS